MWRGIRKSVHFNLNRLAATNIKLIFMLLGGGVGGGGGVAYFKKPSFVHIQIIPSIPVVLIYGMNDVTPLVQRSTF